MTWRFLSRLHLVNYKNCLSYLPVSSDQAYVIIGVPNSDLATTSSPSTSKTRGGVCRIRLEEAKLLVTELLGTKAPHYKSFRNKGRRTGILH